MKAVHAFFEKGLPKNVKEIYNLIDQGVKQYKKDHYQGLVFFEDVLNKLSVEEQNKIESVILTESDGISSDEAMSFAVAGEFGGSVNLYLASILKSVQIKVEKSNARTCAVLTTQSPRGTNATLVIMFDENKKPALFNSHGETYKGEPKGASLLKFNDMKELETYIIKTFFKGEEGQFQLKILRNLTQ